MSEKEKQTQPEVGEDATQYGEFISTYFAWVPLPEQKEKAKKMSKMTKKQKESRTKLTKETIEWYISLQTKQKKL